MNQEQLDLLHGYLNGSLNEPDFARLQSLLQENADARRTLRSLSTVEVKLNQLALLHSEAVRVWVDPPRERGLSTRWHSWWPLTASAVCLGLMMSAWWWQASQRVFATVVNEVGVEELTNGSSLRGETQLLKGGSVELVSARGARIVIEAPAEFRFESAQRLRLMKGRLSAEVPPAAKGFTVVTPSGDAVDLGTRFGVDVPANGAAEIHVFQGEVIAKASGNASNQSLRGGDAVAMNGGGSTARELRSSAFIQPDEMHGLSEGLAAGQRARSEAALTDMRNDPALIALLDFESGEAQPGVFYTV